MASRHIRLISCPALLLSIILTAHSVWAGEKTKPGPRSPANIEDLSYEQLTYGIKEPEGIDPKKAKKAFEILQKLIAKGRAAQRVTSNSSVTSYGYENAVVELKALEVSVPLYLEFMYSTIRNFSRKYSGTYPKADMLRLLTEAIYLYRYFPGKVSVNALTKLVNSDTIEFGHKELALEALPEVGETSVAEVLAGCLSNTDEKLRRLAKLQLITLQQVYPDSDVATPVLRVLEDVNSPKYAKNEAVLILSVFKDARMVAPLVRHLLYLDEKTAVNGIRVLGLFKDKKSRSASVPVLKRALSSGITTERRKWAAISIGRLDDWSTVPALIEALSDREETVREAAHRSLIRLTRKNFSPNPAMWESWWLNEGKNAPRETASQTSGSTSKAGFKGIPERKLSGPPIRPTMVGSNRAGTAPRNRPDSEPEPVSRTRNTVLFILAGVLALTILAIIFFFRKGQGKQ
ncbi:MAG: HEAT repeat domain-containing protein [Planctomycetota bacterium]|jgi:hypothetical protein